jgi:flagellar basal-body rod protein FlgB
MSSLLNLNAYLGIQPQALELQSRRTEVLADNLANVDTPNYKARDIDFQSALAAATGAAGGRSAAGGTLPLETTDPRDIGAAGSASGPSPELKYRVPLAPSLDGNTVDAQLEQAAFAENSVRYQATLTFISTSLRNLMTAITGS